MRNRGNSKISKILETARHLPVFTLDDLASIETDRKYLTVLLSRRVRSGNVVRLKRGMYVTRDYLDQVEKSGRTGAYAECLACLLYGPSYLSLEYELHRHGIITEMPVGVTMVTRKKTASFAPPFGTYKYHSIKQPLFIGFKPVRDGDYLIFRASPAKALFDFLYFRKNQLSDKAAIGELRLNLGALKREDKTELAGYVELEGSVRMRDMLKTLWKN